MKFIYQISLWFYQLLITIVAPFNLKAKQFKEGRKDIFIKIKLALSSNNDPVIWFHCASLGEFEQARPVMELMKKQKPHFKIFLTFFSPSGYEIRKNYTGADWIFYLPIDTYTNASMFIEIVKPKIALFTKYEFWYYYLKVLRSNEIPIYSFSSIFRENQLFFKPYGGFYKSFLKFFNHLFVQDNRSLQLLKSIGIQNVTVAGDTRFDRVAEICANVNEINVANTFKNSELCMVIGSSWPQDMSVLLPLINNEKIQLKYIIAPHEINKEEIKSLQNQINKKSVCFSEVNESTVNQYDVLFIDNIGMLSSLYQYGEMAYIGGAFGKGLHNVLEAATFGMPVIFGPKYSKFVEAINLIKKGVGFSINSSEELLPLVEKLCLDTIYRQNLSDLSKQFVQENTGGSALIVQFLKDENLI